MPSFASAVASVGSLAEQRPPGLKRPVSKTVGTYLEDVRRNCAHESPDIPPPIIATDCIELAQKDVEWMAMMKVIIRADSQFIKEAAVGSCKDERGGED